MPLQPMTQLWHVKSIPLALWPSTLCRYGKSLGQDKPILGQISAPRFFNRGVSRAALLVCTALNMLTPILSITILANIQREQPVRKITPFIHNSIQSEIRIAIKKKKPYSMLSLTYEMLGNMWILGLGIWDLSSAMPLNVMELNSNYSFTPNSIWQTSFYNNYI